MFSSGPYVELQHTICYPLAAGRDESVDGDCVRQRVYPK